MESEVNAIRVNLNGSSVIWQPWFATMSAGLGLGLATSESTSSNAPENDFTSSNVNLGFAVFPLSRFPFQLTYSLNRNETDSLSDSVDGLSTITLVTTARRLGITQGYTTNDRTHINFFLNISDFESLFSNFQSNVAGIRVNKTYAKQRYNVDGNFINNKQNDVGSESTNFSITAVHGYLPSTELGITSLLSFSQSESTSSGSSKSDSNSNQVSANASWRPGHKPYSVSGGVRFSKSTTDNSVGETESSSVGTGLTLAYRFSRQVRSTLALSVTASESDGRQSVNASEIASIGFFAAPITFGDFFYNWNVSGSASNSSSKIDGNTEAVPPEPETNTDSQNASISFGHAASTSWVFSSGNSSLGFSQNMSVSKSFLDESDPASTPVPGEPVEEDDLTKSLSQSMYSTMNHQAWGGNTVLTFAISDSRTFEDDAVSFQLASFSLSRNQGINRVSSASGNFSFQASRTDDPAFPDDSDITKSAAAGFAYRHSRFLGIFALTYSATLVQESLLADDEAEKGNLTWTNSLAYAIGLLSVKLNFRIIESPDGERNVGANFSATRSF
ncbi:MAG: hypothetical protein GXP08_05665 [Gammaproteobacteria bacterium]|nr:hypothetical protein [Gammaproteobacteria bacterium]